MTFSPYIPADLNRLISQYLWYFDVYTLNKEYYLLYELRNGVLWCKHGEAAENVLNSMELNHWHPRSVPAYGRRLFSRTDHWFKMPTRYAWSSPELILNCHFTLQ